MPKVSVVIPTRNRYSTLTRAIRSVAAQTFSDFELIVINDCSTDGTANYLSTLNQTNSVCVNLENPGGGAAARNHGISRASGDYIAFLDDDDTWEPTKLEEQVVAIEEKGAGLCYTGKRIFNRRGRFLRYTCKKPRFTDAYQSIMYDNFIGSTSSIMVRKRLADEIDGFDPSLPALQDWDFYIRLIQKGCALVEIDKPLINYYFMDTANNISLNARNHQDAAQRMKEKYANDPAYHFLKRGLTAVTVKKAFKSWNFLKRLVG